MKISDMNFSDSMVKGFFVALEVTGSRQLSDPAVAVMLKDLAGYPEPQVLAALRRCCREVKPGQFTLEAIISRLEDGRPGPEEAWAMTPKDEASSAYWTTEVRDAFQAAYPLIVAGDLIAARMAFLETYRKLVQLARDARHPLEWQFTPGTDRAGRELVLLDAAEKGRVSAERVKDLLPYHRDEIGLNARLLALIEPTAKRLTAPPSEAAANALRKMKAIVGKESP